MFSGGLTCGRSCRSEGRGKDGRLGDGTEAQSWSVSAEVTETDCIRNPKTSHKSKSHKTRTKLGFTEGCP